MNAIIVDDTKTAIEQLSEKLKRYDDITLVATAMTGEEGLELIERHKPDLLFLDIELPDISGLDFLEKMRENSDAWCYVVVYTAYSEYMLSAFRNKAFDFLLKPIDDDELGMIINRILADKSEGRSEEMQDVEIKSKDGKLLFYTNTIDFRLVQIRDICVFHYDHEARVWTVIAAGCDRPLRLKRGVNKDVILGIDNCFVQVGLRFIININYLSEVRDNVCLFYPPFDSIDYVKVGRFFRRKLISRYNSL